MYWFCHTLTWIHHGCTCVSHPEPPLPPPSPDHPSGSSQCTSPEHLVSCIEPGLAIYFTYMIQCYSLKSSHLHLLPQSPTVCYLHLCLFCWLAYRIIVTIFLNSLYMHSDQIRSVSQSCPTLCDPMNHSTPGLPVHHQLPEFTQTHVHRVSDAIQPSHPQSSPSPPAPNPSQHQSLFQWVNSSHEVAKVLEFHWCFSFWLTSPCIIGSSFIHLIRTDSNAFFVIAE